MRNKSLMRLAVCLIGMAAMVLQGCSESGTDRDKLCGSWSSVEGKPDVLVYKDDSTSLFSSHAHQLSYTILVEYLERVYFQNLLLQINREEGSDIVA